MTLIGDRLPDVPVLDPDGGEMTLRRAAGGDALLIFLRHLT